MIKDLPIDLILASQLVLDIAEDTLSALDTPDENDAPDELSGEKEEIIINPEYRAERGLRNRY